jgi:hypothetical protein
MAAAAASIAKPTADLSPKITNARAVISALQDIETAGNAVATATDTFSSGVKAAAKAVAVATVVTKKATAAILNKFVHGVGFSF